MGCWNKTCGLTGLPISHGEDVLVFVLRAATSTYDRTHTTSLFNPLLLPFKAQHNSYGDGELCTGFVDEIVAGVASALVEMDQGDNEYHDISVSRANFTVETFFEAVREGRLFTETHDSDTNLRLDYVMMRVDSVDYILNHWKRKLYVGYTNNRTDPYYQYTFNDVVLQVSQLVKNIEQIIVSSTKTQLALLPCTARILDTPEFGENGVPNIAAQMLRSIVFQRYRYCNVVNPQEMIVELIRANRTDRAHSLIVDLLTGIYIDEFFNSVRKIWVPGCHEGSQADVDQSYAALSGAIMQCVDNLAT